MYDHKALEQMWSAVESGNLEWVKDLHKKGVCLNNGRLLIEAVDRGYANIVEYFIKNNVDVNLTGIGGGTALHAAAHFGYIDIVQLLLSTGTNKCDVNKVCDLKSTPLFDAVFSKNTEIVDLIVAHGGNVHHIDSFGKNLLHTAVYTHDLNMVSHILRLGVNTEQKNNDNYTPLQLAQKYNIHNVINLLSVGI